MRDLRSNAQSVSQWHAGGSSEAEANVEYHYYETGHMIFAHLPSLAVMHDRIAEFIGRTSGAR